MNKKSKIGLNAIWLLGIIYAILGGVFVIIGLVLAIKNFGGDTRLVGIIFSGIGGLFLCLGLIFIFVQLAKKRRNDRLIEAGRYVWAEVISYNLNLQVTINHRHPYIVTLRHTDAYGNSRLFKSGSLNIPDPQPLIGRQVKVYMDSANESHYYVDMEALLNQSIT